MWKAASGGWLLCLVLLLAGCSSMGALPDKGIPILPPQATPSPPTAKAPLQPTASVARPVVSTPEPAAGAGEIIGQLVNGTAGAATPAGVTMTLYALDANLETVFFTQTRPADANGWARFEALETASGALYAIVAEYQNVFYFNEPQPFPPAQTSLILPVTVYESTSDPSAIRIDQWHVILDLQPGHVQVSQVLIVSNTSDRAFTDGGLSLRIKLPPGATGLRFDDGELGARYVSTGDGLADTEAVRPGERAHQILFSFVLPYTGDWLDVALPTAYPVMNVNVLLSDVGAQLASEQLAPAGSRQATKGAYLNFTGRGPLAAGQALSFRLSGAVKSANTPAFSSNNSWTMLAGAVIILALVLGGVFVRRRSSPIANEAPLPDQESLLDAIAALDDAYAAGELPESEYHHRRAELKAQLAEMTSGE